MKTRTLFVIPIIIFVVAIFFFASCTTTGDENGAVTPGVTPTLAGTWVNPDYDGEALPAKVVVIDNGDGTFTGSNYDTVSDTEPSLTSIVPVTDEWTDSEGNLFYKVDLPAPIDMYELIKIHADNQTIEVNMNEFEYPTEIDPADESYGIYYRQ